MGMYESLLLLVIAFFPMGMYESLLLLVIAFFLAMGALLVYFLPSIIAFRKHHPNRWIIFVLNLLLGGTVVVWIVVLIWALTPPTVSSAQQAAPDR